jgi:hypothetical protein
VCRKGTTLRRTQFMSKCGCTVCTRIAMNGCGYTISLDAMYLSLWWTFIRSVALIDALMHIDALYSIILVFIETFVHAELFPTVQAEWIYMHVINCFPFITFLKVSLQMSPCAPSGPLPPYRQMFWRRFVPRQIILYCSLWWWKNCLNGAVSFECALLFALHPRSSSSLISSG